MRYFHFFFVLFICALSFGQEDLYEIPFSEKIDSAELVITGEVISTSSYVDSVSQMILTKNRVEVYSIFKGDGTLDTITIVTQGGKVGNQITITSSLLSLNQSDFGMFFCYKEDSSDIYKVYASKQGFFKFNRERTKAICPFNHVNVSDLLQLVKSSMQGKPFEKKPLILPSLLTRSIGGAPSFFPSILTAGTGEVLTITGSGFGTSGPTNTEYVAFADANNGGAPSFIQPNISSYLTWTDSLIEVIVPSRAGTGPILVETSSTTQESSDTLVIPFAIINTLGSPPLEAVLVDQNGNGGSNWTMGLSFSGNSIENAFSRAVDTWECATGVNWDITPNSTALGAPANDGVNIVAPMTLPAGVLGQCHTHLSSCNGSIPYVVGQDLVFSPTANWNFSTNPPASNQVDFESVALHELGHALQIAHIVETHDLLHFSISPGDMRRTLSPVNILAGNYVMDRSTFLNPCSSIAHVQNFPATCTQPNTTDARILGAETILDDSTCIGVQDIELYFGNFGPDTLYSMNIDWSVNGIQQTGMSWSGALGLNDIVPSITLGMYDFQDSSYQIKIWLSSQNGVQEINTEGDTLSYTFHPVNCSPDDASVVFFNEFDSLGCYSSEVLQCAVVNTGENYLTNCWVHFDDGQGNSDSLFWSGALSTGDTSSVLNLTNYTQFSENNAFAIWTSLPNGVQDTYTANDTLNHSFDLFRMSGTYTIGGMNPDFNHPSDAINRLNTYGVCGDVTLNIRSGIYIGTYVINDIPMDSTMNYNLTIQSETLDSTDVILRSPPNNAVLIFWEAQNVTLRSLTFDKDSLNNNLDICRITRNSKDINIESCQFGSLYHSADDENINITDWPFNIISGPLWSVQNVTISNNHFVGGSDGVRAYSINADIFAENIKISNNYFSQVPTEMDIRNSIGIEITNNHFFDDAPFGGTSFEYVHLGLDTAFIRSNFFLSSSTSRAVKITSPQSSGDSPVVFTSNSVSHLERVYSLIGTIELIDVGSVFFINNSLYSRIANGTSSSGPIIRNDIKDSLVVYNNQFIYDGNGPIFDHESSYSLNALNSDHNNFLTDGSFSWGGGGTTFNEHKMITGQDNSSIFIDPMFISEDTLIPMNVNPINNQGIPWVGVSTDILGTTRDQFTPDIGAYEFGGENIDVMLDSISQPSNYDCNNLGNTIAVVLKNNDTDSVLQNALIDWSVNGISGQQYNWTGSLAPGQTEEVVVSNYAFTSGVNYEIHAQVSEPNGEIDNIPLNDSVYLHLLGDLSIIGEDTVCYGDTVILFSSYEDSSASYLWNIGATSSELAVHTGGIYSLTLDAFGCPSFTDSFEVFVLPELISSFTVVDDTILQSDQIGNYSYQWYLNGTELINQTSSDYHMIYDGSYTLEITDQYGCSALSDPYQFNSSTIGVNELEKLDYLIVPNPSSSMIRLILPDDYSGLFELFDASGRSVLKTENVKSEQVIPLDAVSEGIYFVKMQSMGTKRLIVIK